MQQYARWAAMARGADPKPVTADEFYDDPHAQSLFRNFLGVLVSRVNTLTGVAYKYAHHDVVLRQSFINLRLLQLPEQVPSLVMQWAI
jgi:hypothetical protein